MSGFELVRVKGAPVSDEDLLEDLRRVAQTTGESVTQKTYDTFGSFSRSTVERRFGTWNAALLAAGLAVANELHLSDERLFENLLTLWQHLGRQPRRRELSQPPSTISESPYNRRFGSWSGALQAFVAYANASEADVELQVRSSDGSGVVRKGGRDPSLRLRFKVLQRDRFTCQHCGASPAKALGVELHVDHIVPWSRGGETVLENLQTLCARCNLGKSNMHE